MKELYVAVSGAIGREKQMTVVANNLANVNSVAFKRQKAVFALRPPEVDFQALEMSADERMNLPAPRQWLEGDLAYTKVDETVTDYSGGVLRQTGGELDLALECKRPESGTPFFSVNTSEGRRLTRMGNLTLNQNGELVTHSGLRVNNAASGGALQVNSRLKIGISPTGEVFSGNQSVGRLDLVMVNDPTQLEPQGEGLYSDLNGQVTSRPVTAADQVSVKQGCLEFSNVNIVDELVQMIELQRSYASHQKSIQTMDEETAKVIEMVRM